MKSKNGLMARVCVFVSALMLVFLSIRSLAQSSTDRPRIVVGPNVHVSNSRAGDVPGEASWDIIDSIGYRHRHGGESAMPPSVRDAVEVTRVQFNRVSSGDMRWAVFSPDGSRFALVILRADVDRDTNVHSLLLFDKEDVGRTGPPVTPAPLVSLDFAGDPEVQFTSPISDITILGDNRTVAFLGRKDGKPAQVYTVDAQTRELRRLTDSSDEIRSYIVSPDGKLLLYTVAREDEEWRSRHSGPAKGGVFPLDPLVNPLGSVGSYADYKERPQRTRQFILASIGEKVFDSTMSPMRSEEEYGGIASLTPDPTAQYVLIHPFRAASPESSLSLYHEYKESGQYEQNLCTPYGLMDLTTGKVEYLLDAPHPLFSPSGGSPLWSPDGHSVLIHTLLPLTGPDAEARAKGKPQWVEIDILTRQTNPVAVPEEWKPVFWERSPNSVIIAKGNVFSRIRKDSKGRWSEPVSIGETEKLSNLFSLIAPSTNGRIVVGVIEGPTQPTEIAAFDLKTRTQTVLTDFNEPARKLSYVPAEKIDWKGVIAGPCTGYLFRPIGYEPGRRYPLAILLDDGVLSYGDPPFMIAGGLFHLSAHPVQALAASGIAVLYTREPSILRDVVETAKEGPVMMDHVESAIAHLDRIGLVDPARVGVSGWSRAGYYTDYIIIHARHRLAAALSIDGGTDEYNPAGDSHDGSRPFTDEELKSIRTPLLAEAHGLRSLIGHGKFIDRLKALGGQVELLYFPTASHSTERPSDRMSSLGIALDWFRFWLQDYEDPDEAKARQYERWRELRKLKSNAKG